MQIIKVNNNSHTANQEKKDDTPNGRSKAPSRKISEKEIFITSKDEDKTHDLSGLTQNIKKDVVSLAQDVKRALIIDEINDSIN